jgi:hypothetical protein
MITIDLTRSLVTVVDDLDSDLANLNWYAQFQHSYADGGKYVAARSVYVDSRQTTEFMHRVILSRILGRPLLRPELVDHEDRNPLNNCRYNLRLASNSQNQGNTGTRTDNTSGFRGVYWSKQANLWRAGIKRDGRQRHLGYFDTAEEAARIYDEAARNHFGEFAVLNFPDHLFVTK